jgi:hypothetical protein
VRYLQEQMKSLQQMKSQQQMKSKAAGQPPTAR